MSCRLKCIDGLSSRKPCIHLMPELDGATNTGMAAVEVTARIVGRCPVMLQVEAGENRHEGLIAHKAPAGEEEAAAAKPAPRYTIHTARYRLTLKGVDRGKWDFDVVAEADASLEALDKVVRGVQRRSGEGAEPDRLTTDAFREALEAPLATLER